MAQNIWSIELQKLRHLNSKKLVHGITAIKKPKKSCNVCMRGKQQRLPFASEVAPRVKHSLGVVH